LGLTISDEAGLREIRERYSRQLINSSGQNPISRAQITCLDKLRAAYLRCTAH
jgi:hypothetical protein